MFMDLTATDTENSAPLFFYLLYETLSKNWSLWENLAG